MKNVFVYLHERLTSYSRLEPSKYEMAITEDLKLALVFTISLQNAKVRSEVMEEILEFLSCFNNNNETPVGIFYEKIQDEYVIHTKTQKNAFLLDGFLQRAISSPETAMHYITNARTFKNDIELVFNFKQTSNKELQRLFSFNERSCLDLLARQEELAMKERKRINAENAEQEELEEERKRIEYENQLKEKVRQEMISSTQAQGGKNRHKDTDTVKLQIIKPLYLNKEKIKGITANARAKKISELLNNVYAKHDDKIKQFAIEYSLDGAILISKEAKKYFSDDKTSQIYKWCLAIDKGEI